MSSISAVRIGKCNFTFKDGSKFTWEGPKCYIDGLLSKEKLNVFYDRGWVKDTSNGNTAEIRYNPTYEDTYKGMVGRWLGSKAPVN